jgi:putative inorganic carbon (HCO3(-)) transporter
VRLTALRRLVANPWLYACVAVCGIVAGVHHAPVQTALLVVGLVAAGFLLWRFGIYRGLWYLVLLTLPLKEPLSFDIYGTVSVFTTDLVLVFLFTVAIASVGFRKLWSVSVSFRLEIAIVVLSVAGLYSATRFFWGTVGVYRLLMLVAVYVVGRTVITDREEAIRSIFVVCLSLVAPSAFGIYQSTIPFGAELPDWGGIWTAYDAFGKPSYRVFSTMDNPLNLSHYLTVGFGLCVGLAVGLRRRVPRIVLACAAALAAFCNLYTYSAAGVAAIAAAIVVVVLLVRSGRLLAVALVILVAATLLAPPALLAKVERILGGEALTAAARLVTYKQAMNVLRDHPVFGLGWGGIRHSLEGAYRLSRAEAVAFTAENYFLQRAIALGLVGLGLYVGLWARFAGNLRRMLRLRGASSGPDPLVTAMAAGAAAFLTIAMLIPATNVSVNSVLWLMFAIASSLSKAGVPADEVG